MKVESAEEIAREEGLFNLFPSIRPLANTLIKRQETLVAPGLKVAEDQRLTPAAHLKREPRQRGRNSVLEAVRIGQGRRSAGPETES